MLYLNNVAELGGHLSGHSCDADRTVESMSGSNSEHILDEGNLDNTTTTSILRKDYLGTSIDFTLEDIPQTYEDALASTESDYWKAAIENEVNGLIKLKTYIIGDLPINKKPIKLRWVFSRKPPARYKARMVAKGFMQHYGVDYSETFSPVARYSTTRLFFSLCALLSLYVNQMDVDYAFPNAELEQGVEIWAEPLPGMNVPRGKYILLKKALYGLKQAARQWNSDINTYMESIGFTRLRTDPCIYVRGNYGLGTLIIILLYVDDMGIAAQTIKLLNKTKNDFLLKYSMKDLGEPKKMLGMQVHYSLNRIFIGLSDYITKLYQKYQHLITLNGTYRTPMAVNTRLSKILTPPTEEERIYMTSVPYREIVGGLLWCSLICRPDLAFAVNQVAKFNSDPRIQHWEALQRILLYAYQNKDWGIQYLGPKDVNQQYDPIINFGSWADANFSTDPDTSLSVSGNIDVMNLATKREKGLSGSLSRLANGPINWCSKTQDVVALSTQESEFYAAALSVQEAIAQTEMLEELGIDTVKPRIIQEDNKACIWYSEHPGTYEKTKHIRRKFHFVQQHVSDGTVKLEYCPSSENLADFFTKPLTIEQFEYFRSIIMYLWGSNINDM